MKTSLYLLIFLIPFTAFSQVNSHDMESLALSNVNKMAKMYNSDNGSAYVNFLTPGDYNNDSVNKKMMVKMFTQIMQSDTSHLLIKKLLLLKTNKDEVQALFQTHFHQNDGYIAGVSYNKGEQWYFSQPLNNRVKFALIQKCIPSFDTAFASICDPKFGKRINYQENKNIAGFKYVDINGNEINSEKLKGKIIVLNFWSIGCGPCIKEIPELNEIVQKKKGKNIEFIALSLYSPEKVLKTSFLPKHPFSYKVVPVTNDDDYSIFQFPTHIVIDQNQKVVLKLTGASPENLSLLNQKIDELLND